MTTDDRQIQIGEDVIPAPAETISKIKRKARVAKAATAELAKASARQAAEIAHPAGSIASGPCWELRLGLWQRALPEVTASTLIMDAPYGKRTHESEAQREDDSDAAGLAPEYEAWTPDHVHEAVRSWSPRITGWMVCMTSHDLIPAYEDAFREADRYCFAPVTAQIVGMTVRAQGDGPSSWTIYIMCARPMTAEFAKWGTLPGGYRGKRRPGAGGGRGKPDWLCNALVRHYSRPGDTIVDPLAGWATTLEAALGNGRSAIGGEMDVLAYAEGLRRLRRGIQVDMFGAAPPEPDAESLAARLSEVELELEEARVELALLRGGK